MSTKAKFIALYENSKGKKVSQPIDCDSLEDATISATNYAEEKGYELLAVDEA